MFTKIVLTVAVLATLLLAQEGKGDVDANVNKQACIKDADVNPSYVEKAYGGEVKDARELKCYFKCYYQNAGYMNLDGKIEIEKLKANIPGGVSKTAAKRVIDVCANRPAAPNDPCDAAYQMQKCLIENDIKY